MRQPFRILVVDDFEPFRRFVRRALQQRPEFRVVGEASDGMEAVQKAKDLKPDVVLLDIGLPKLNGLAAAEQIGSLAPDAKILIVTLECSSAIVEEALRLGALGYIHKLRVQADLIPGIEAVLAGKQFLSNNLEFNDSAKLHGRHDVQFCSDEVVFLESATHFVGEALKSGGAAIVVAASSHRERLLQTLKAAVFNFDAAIQQGTCISLNAAELLAHFMVNGVPDRGRLITEIERVIESSVKATKAKHPRLSVFGECAPLLWAQGNTEGAIQLERICSDLLKTYDVDILCAYPLSPFEGARDRTAFNSICAEHTAVFSR